MPVLVVVAIFLFSLLQNAVVARAQEEPPLAQTAEPRETEYNEEDYDFSWLDPDKKIYVLQNRKYVKARKLEVSLAAGLNLSGDYTSSTMLMGRGFYYFAEQFGVSVLYASQYNRRNDTFRELVNSGSSVFPNIRDVTSFYGASFVWIPFYGKLNLFNEILYVDWALEAGIASVNTVVNINFQANAADNFQSASFTGFFWGTGWKFFISRMFAVRLDMLGLYYSAPIVRRGAVTSESASNPNYYMTLGLSAHF